MNELLNRFIANGFADFEGLQLTGSVPVKQELINEVIADLLQQGQTGASAAPAPEATTPAPSSSTGRPKLNPRELLRFVKRAEVSAQDGKLILNFDVRVDGR